MFEQPGVTQILRSEAVPSRGRRPDQSAEELFMRDGVLASTPEL